MQKEYCEFCGEVKGYWDFEENIWIEILKHRTCRLINELQDISILEKNYQQDTFENSIVVEEKEKEYLADFVKYCQNFKIALKEGIGMIFSGNAGTGKTYYTHCIINELKKNKYSVLSFNISKYLIEIKTEGFETKEKEILEAINKADLIVIDDIGNEKFTDWSKERMFNLFNTIYMNRKSLLCSTNLSGEQLKEHFSIYGSEKILDRILELCKPYKFDWKSRRAKNGQANFKKIWVV